MFTEGSRSDDGTGSLVAHLFIMGTMRPALSHEEWQHRRSGAVAVKVVGDEAHLVVEDPDGDVVSVGGADETVALMALANDSLPDTDAHKFTVADVAVCRLVLERFAATELDARLADLVNRLCAKVEALLPVQ
jgi:hypothetical protein